MFKARKIAIVLLSVLLLVSITGCGKKERRFDSLPLTVNDTEVLVGESTLQTFIDAGYKVTLDRDLKEDIAGQTMPPMSYDIATYISKDDKIAVKVNFLNNTKSIIHLEDCIVYEYEIKYDDPTGYLTYDADNILVDGVNIKGMKLEDVKEAFKEKVESFDEFDNLDCSIGVILFELGKVDVGKDL
ncbi:hypothetical protein [Tissierella praeacuta]|uniref:hypothetical protein n=1 Tax=Tissierella praeacuta TaxID=43131 RepID=UPI00333F06EF